MFQTVELNIVPGGDMPVVNASQFDTNRVIRFALMNNGEAYRPRNLLSAEFIIRKVDGTLVTQDDAVFASNFIDLMTTEQMTACAGKNIGELRLTFNDPDISEENVIISTLNFILEVERSPELGGIESESEIANLDSQIAAIVDQQLDNYYTKTEIDEQIETIVTEQVTPIVADIVAEQVPPAVQAELDNYYTKDETDTYFYNKTETDTLLSGKADVSSLPDMSTYYTKTETDTLLAGKVSNSTLNDYYTKTQVDTLISSVSTDFLTSIDTPASIQTFSDGGNNIPMKSCEVAIVAQQAGTGTPSPSNPRAISGFDSVDVVVTGKNLLDISSLNSGLPNTTIGSSITDIATNTRYAFSNIIPSNSSEISFRYKSTNTTVYSQILFYAYKQGILVNYQAVNAGITVNVEGTKTITGLPEHDCIRIVLGASQGNDVALDLTSYGYCQCEEGSTATAYEPFGTTTPVSLGQTIYGGTAELVGGNGIKTYDRVDLSTLNWIYVPSINVFYADNDLGEYRGVGKIGLCEIYDVVDNVPRALDVPVTNNIICGYSDTDIHRLYCRNTAYTDATQFKNSMVGKYLVYKLATPTTFTFTGANIPTLSGVNNVYADSGDVNALEYFNNKADDIASMVILMTRS